VQENDAFAFFLIQILNDLIMNTDELLTVMKTHICDQGLLDLDTTEIITVLIAAHHLKRARAGSEDSHRGELGEQFFSQIVVFRQVEDLSALRDKEIFITMIGR
jgi:hypothetical protein